MSEPIHNKRVRGFTWAYFDPAMDSPPTPRKTSDKDSTPSRKYTFNNPTVGQAVVDDVTSDVKSLSQHLQTMGTDIHALIDPKADVPEFKTFQNSLGLLGSTSVVTGSFLIEQGVNQFKTAMKVRDVGSSTLAMISIIRGITKVVGGAISTVLSSFSLVAIETMNKAMKVASQVLGTVSSVVGFISYTLLIVPKAINLDKACQLRDFLKDKKSSTLLSDIVDRSKGMIQLDKFGEETSAVKLENKDPEVETKGEDAIKIMRMIKSVAPKTYQKLIEGETDQSLLVLLEQEIAEAISMNSISITAAAAMIICAILSMVLTGPIPVLVLACITLIIGAGLAGIDFVGMIDALKAAKKLNTRDIIIKVITIVLAIVSLVVSWSLAPSAIVGIVALIIGSIIVAIPTSTLIAMLIKEKIITDKEKKETEELIEKAKVRNKEVEVRLQQLEEEVVARRKEEQKNQLKEVDDNLAEALQGEFNDIDDFMEAFNKEFTEAVVEEVIKEEPLKSTEKPKPTISLNKNSKPIEERIKDFFIGIVEWFLRVA